MRTIKFSNLFFLTSFFIWGTCSIALFWVVRFHYIDDYRKDLHLRREQLTKSVGEIVQEPIRRGNTVLANKWLYRSTRLHDIKEISIDIPGEYRHDRRTKSGNDYIYP